MRNSPGKEMIIQPVVYYFIPISMILGIDLSKQKALDADQKAIHKSILLEMYRKIETQQCFLVLRKKKKAF